MTYFNEYKNKNGEIEKENIKKIIPYGDEFLLIDKVLILEENRIIAEKKVHKNDPVFKAHFIDFPIYPGALIIEGLGQSATLLVRSKIENHDSKDILAYLISTAKFRKPVFPNDTLKFEVIYKRGDTSRVQCQTRAIVKDHIVAECDMTLAIVDKEEFRGKYG